MIFTNKNFETLKHHGRCLDAAAAAASHIRLVRRCVNHDIGFEVRINI